MRQDIIDSLKDEVKKRYESEDNFFGIGGYYHIRAVVKNAVSLAESYGADIEVVTIGAWLQDIASVTDYNFYEDHHIHGARIAGDMLSNFNYPNEKIELVQKCILNHRGSKLLEKSSKEEI
ncbi:HD domain-containing protein [Clostridium sp. UBA4395]|uniref:HD domain-containing protein n=1 Tax=Clostridium sp. UBA4395 TaxID=1946360 RepID=UPI003217BF96